MKKLYTFLIALLSFPMTINAADGWPAGYNGVMLQGFYWDSFDASRWTRLERMAPQFSGYFDLVWIPQSARAAGAPSMGYDPLYWFADYNSSFGTEEELRSMIATFKANGIGTIADVVINHRGNVSTWVDFPAETYKGVTYQLQSTDICKNDDGGKTLAWAQANGFQLSGNNDSGEGWDGMRDLDHNSTNVQNNVNAYLAMLLSDMGYAGFRYDMVKGFAGRFIGMYNKAANPQFSVGEYWDGNASVVKNWLDATQADGAVQSGAFDFPFRYTVRDAANNGDWTKLKNASVMGDAAYRRYSVTFIENHDTEKRENAAQDPIVKDTLAANAYMLAMPGTPCVFYKHYLAYPNEIKAMIDARKAAGITNTSGYFILVSQAKGAAYCTTGTVGQLIVAVGDKSVYQPTEQSYTRVLTGHNYSYYLDRRCETVFADCPSGEYDKAFEVTLTAVSATDGAQVVYTIDGTQPTASSAKFTGSGKVAVSDNCTLNVGLLVNGVVKSVISRKYTFSKFEPYDINVFVNTDAVKWNTVNFWTWGGDGSHATASGVWPGDKVTATQTVDGKSWYTKTYTINSEFDYVNFVFSTGTGSPQTVDVTGVNKSTYLEISAEKDGTKYKVNDVTGTVTGIGSVTTGSCNTGNVYSISGVLVRRNAKNLDGLKQGIYICNGKKIVVK